jgi:hypothetical protein
MARKHKKGIVVDLKLCNLIVLKFIGTGQTAAVIDLLHSAEDDEIYIQ